MMLMVGKISGSLLAWRINTKPAPAEEGSWSIDTAILRHIQT
jgi:hypothetical protein